MRKLLGFRIHAKLLFEGHHDSSSPPAWRIHSQDPLADGRVRRQELRQARRPLVDEIGLRQTAH